MSITWSYHICQMGTESTPKPNTVTEIKAYIYGIDDTTGKNNTEVFNVTLPPADSSNFIDYSSLTESQVLNWVEGLLGPEEVTHIKSKVEAKIVHMNNTAAGINTESMLDVPPPLPW